MFLNVYTSINLYLFTQWVSDAVSDFAWTVIGERQELGEYRTK